MQEIITKESLSPEPDSSSKNINRNRIKIAFAIAGVLLFFGILWWQVPALRLGWTGGEAETYQTKYEKDEFVRFDMEIYDIIVENYWQKVDEKELAELFRLSLGKALGGTEEVLPSKDRQGVAKMLASAIKRIEEPKRKGLAVDTGIVVLANLYPNGRSGLLSDKQETEFRDNVNNINRDKDLYVMLGLASGASIEEVAKEYGEKKALLEKDNSAEAKEELERLSYAYTVLSDTNTKAIYDETKMEPSVSSRVLSGNALYLDLSNITPATFQEIAVKLDSIDKVSRPSGIIIDLRGNVGGALDFAKYFLALFQGPNQYAFDLFQQGELNVERTPAIAKIESLEDIEDIAILTDESTQSTAELMSATFKRFNRAKVIGTQTKGHGTVENTFPIETTFDDTEKYSVLLVHSLTLRDDGEAIEERGVDPDVDINKLGWQSEVSKIFRSAGFSRDVVQILEDK